MNPKEAIEEINRIIKELQSASNAEEVAVACVRLRDARFWLKEYVKKTTISDEDFQKLIEE